MVWFNECYRYYRDGGALRNDEQTLRAIIDETKREFPTLDELGEAIGMVQHTYPDSHVFSKRYVLEKLITVREGLKKWFGEQTK